MHALRSPHISQDPQHVQYMRVEQQGMQRRSPAQLGNGNSNVQHDCTLTHRATQAH